MKSSQPLKGHRQTSGTVDAVRSAMKTMDRSLRKALLLVTTLILGIANARSRGSAVNAEPGTRRPGTAYTEAVGGSTLTGDDGKTLPDLTFRMVFIPAGRYMMGIKQGEKEMARAAEAPAHQVQLSAFWMSEFEVTSGLYWRMRCEEKEMESGTPRLSAAQQAAAKLGIPQGMKDSPFRGKGVDNVTTYPMAGLTQYGAQRFCQWLSARTGRYYRLPTEAEWEYAARAGSGARFFWGDNPKKAANYAWYGGTLSDGSHPVGQKQPNPWGLYDIYGNVAEWTLDGWSEDYGRFAGKIAIDPWQARKFEERFGVVRGGDWTSGLSQIRSAARGRHVDFRPESSGEFFPEFYDCSDNGARVGLRVVHPVERDTERKGMPARASYLKPFGWTELAEFRKSAKKK